MVLHVKPFDFRRAYSNELHVILLCIGIASGIPLKKGHVIQEFKDSTSGEYHELSLPAFNEYPSKIKDQNHSLLRKTDEIVSTEPCQLYFNPVEVEYARTKFDKGMEDTDIFQFFFYLKPQKNLNYKYLIDKEDVYWNGLQEWIWFKLEYKFYAANLPVDLDDLTFGISHYGSKNIIITWTLSGNCNQTGSIHYEQEATRIKEYLWNQIIKNSTLTESRLCHRNFIRDKNFLENIYKVLTIWNGYDFDCYSENKMKEGEFDLYEESKDDILKILVVVVGVLGYMHPFLFRLVETLQPNEHNWSVFHYYKDTVEIEKPYSIVRGSKKIFFGNWVTYENAKNKSLTYIPIVRMFLLLGVIMVGLNYYLQSEVTNEFEEIGNENFPAVYRNGTPEYRKLPRKATFWVCAVFFFFSSIRIYVLFNEENDCILCIPIRFWSWDCWYTPVDEIIVGAANQNKERLTVSRKLILRFSMLFNLNFWIFLVRHSFCYEHNTGSTGTTNNNGSNTGSTGTTYNNWSNTGSTGTTNNNGCNTGSTGTTNNNRSNTGSTRTTNNNGSDTGSTGKITNHKTNACIFILHLIPGLILFCVNTGLAVVSSVPPFGLVLFICKKCLSDIKELCEPCCCCCCDNNITCTCNKNTCYILLSILINLMCLFMYIFSFREHIHIFVFILRAFFYTLIIGFIGPEHIFRFYIVIIGALTYFLGYFNFFVDSYKKILTFIFEKIIARTERQNDEGINRKENNACPFVLEKRFNFVVDNCFSVQQRIVILIFKTGLTFAFFYVTFVVLEDSGTFTQTKHISDIISYLAVLLSPQIVKLILQSPNDQFIKSHESELEHLYEISENNERKLLFHKHANDYYKSFHKIFCEPLWCCIEGCLTKCFCCCCKKIETLAVQRNSRVNYGSMDENEGPVNEANGGRRHTRENVNSEQLGNRRNNDEVLPLNRYTRELSIATGNATEPVNGNNGIYRDCTEFAEKYCCWIVTLFRSLFCWTLTADHGQQIYWFGRISDQQKVDIPGVICEDPDALERAILSNNDDEQNLQANSKQLGFKYNTSRSRDGGCFYKAVSDQLEIIGRRKTESAELRNGVLEFFNQNPVIKKTNGNIVWREYVGLEHQNMESYINKMSKEKVFADYLIVFGMSLFLKCNIAIIKSRPNIDHENEKKALIWIPFKNVDATIVLGHMWENQNNIYLPLHPSSFVLPG